MTASPLVLGTMLFGTRVGRDTAFALLDRFVERGGEWIDTADCYAFWLSESGRGDDSERVIGEWLAARPGVRDRVGLSTKVGAEPAGGDGWRGWPANREGLGAPAVSAALDGSLARLGVDAVDLLWLHQEDRSVPIEETVDAVAGHVAAGRVRRVGASNHPAWLVERARLHAIACGTRPVDAVQLAATYLRVRPGATPPGNDHRFGQLGGEQLDHAAATGMEIWGYTPLLRGAYDRADRPVPEVFDHPGTRRGLTVLAEVAAETGLRPGQVVLSWLAGGDPAIRPIVGATTVGRLDQAFDAVARPLPAELRDRLDAVEP